MAVLQIVATAPTSQKHECHQTSSGMIHIPLLLRTAVKQLTFANSSPELWFHQRLPCNPSSLLLTAHCSCPLGMLEQGASPLFAHHVSLPNPCSTTEVLLDFQTGTVMVKTDLHKSSKRLALSEDREKGSRQVFLLKSCRQCLQLLKTC